MNLISNNNPKSGCIWFYLCLLFCGVAASIAALKYMDFVIASGHFIEQTDMATDYIIGVLWAAVLGISIFFWPVSFVNKKYLLIGWLAKIFVTLGLMLVYESHYGLDSFWYFNEARLGWFGWDGLDIQSVNNIIRRIAWFHQCIGITSYHAVKITFSMLGLIGIYLYYRASVIFLKRENPKIFLLFALFPGILFWSSILGKDPIVFLGIALYVYGVIGFWKLNHLSYLVIIALGVAIATVIRQWLGPIMMLPLLILFLRGKSSIVSKVALLLFVVILFGLTAETFMKRFEIDTLQDLMVNAEGISKGLVDTPSGSTQDINIDFTSARGVISFLPIGAFTALFRPLPGEVLNPFGLIAGLESSLLLVLLWLSIKRTGFSELKEPLVMWAILFIVTWALVHGIVSSANFGLAVRYRLQILPVLLGLLVYLSRKRNTHRTAK